jgi:transcription elongation factor Elf1
MKTAKHIDDDKLIHCPECGSLMLLPTNVSIMGRNAECLECGLEFAVKLKALPDPDEEDLRHD